MEKILDNTFGAIVIAVAMAVVAVGTLSAFGYEPKEARHIAALLMPIWLLCGYITARLMITNRPK